MTMLSNFKLTSSFNNLDLCKIEENKEKGFSLNGKRFKAYMRRTGLKVAVKGTNVLG